MIRRLICALRGHEWKVESGQDESAESGQDESAGVTGEIALTTELWCERCRERFQTRITLVLAPREPVAPGDPRLN